MRELFRKLHDMIRAGEDVVLVTIVATSGSVPRGSGARMLVTKQGRLCGTIGGGAIEYESIAVAGKVLSERMSRSEYFSLHKNDVADIGMICGGDANVFFRFCAGKDAGILQMCDLIETLFAKHSECFLITETTEMADGAIAARSADGRFAGDDLPDAVLKQLPEQPQTFSYQDRTFYVEKIVRPGCVYIFGGGHIARELVPVLARCDFACVVVEDREDYADAALFDHLAETVCLPVDEMSPVTEKITKDDFVCIMTRGHRNDYRAMFEALKTPACYIGVIGSRSKIADTRARLMEDGYTEAEIDRITAPIGLPIQSKTPAEIAVSIAAQLILVRAKQQASL
ncbi:MAG: XdhC family protein [Lachnospiraceae bacterium]|nr:XdhC family protein [Lachnospiraceae bacterium]